MLDPKALADLPFAAFLITIGLVIIGAFMSGQVRSKREVDAGDKVWAARLEELRKDRDEWKALAQGGSGTIAELATQNERLTEVNEKLIGALSSKVAPKVEPV